MWEFFERLGDAIRLLAGKRDRLRVRKIYQIEIDNSQIEQFIESILKLDESLESPLEKVREMAKHFENIAGSSEVVSEEFADNEVVQEALKRSKSYDHKKPF